MENEKHEPALDELSATELRKEPQGYYTPAVSMSHPQNHPQTHAFASHRSPAAPHQVIATEISNESYAPYYPPPPLTLSNRPISVLDPQVHAHQHQQYQFATGQPRGVEIPLYSPVAPLGPQGYVLPQHHRHLAPQDLLSKTERPPHNPVAHPNPQDNIQELQFQLAIRQDELASRRNPQLDRPSSPTIIPASFSFRGPEGTGEPVLTSSNYELQQQVYALQAELNKLQAKLNV